MSVDDARIGDTVSAGHGASEMSHRQPTTDADLEKLEHDSFNYFLYEANAANGLVIDKTAPRN